MASKFWTVAMYEEDRCYGGPEEGGWWYDAGQILEDRPVRTFRNEEAAYAYARRLNHWLNRLVNCHRPSIGSVLSEGHYVADVHEGHAPQYYPETRPYYE